MRTKQQLKIVASIEARMTSSRLPGKVMMEVGGKPILQYMIERVQQSKLIDEIVVATTINKTDEPIVELCNKLGINVFQGSENDVLSRVLDCHHFMNSDVIVELTGDCPLIDPVITDQIISEYLRSDADYVSNAHVRSYPDGLDVQVFATSVLEDVHAQELSSEDREHVSLYIYSSGKYKLKEVIAPKSLQRTDIIITLDNREDYDLIKTVVEEEKKKGMFFTSEEIVQFLDENPLLKEHQKGAVYHDIPSQKKFNDTSN